MARTACEIANDFGCVITVIRGSADLARAKLEPGHPAVADVARIVRSCEEAAARAMELRRAVSAPADAAEIERTASA